MWDPQFSIHIPVGRPDSPPPQSGVYVPSEYLIAERVLGPGSAPRPAIITDDIDMPPMPPVIGETRPFETRAGTIFHEWDGAQWIQSAMPTVPTIVKGAEAVSIITDVWDVVSDIFTDDPNKGWWDTWGTPPIVAPPLTGQVLPPAGSGTPPAPPGYGQPMAPGQCSTGPKPVYKMVCGVYKWVYPKRRRRRQLLTDSDYNSLLRIQNLKVNTNMNVAISKALTR